jgi:hypothetical protein
MGPILFISHFKILGCDMPVGGFLHDTGAFRGKPVKIYSPAQGKL